jgi:glycosyltransferase 2 family protein
MNLRRILTFTVKVTAALLIAYFVLRTVLSNWGQIRSYGWDFDPLFMGLSFSVFIAAYLFLAWTWGRVLRYTGYPVSYRDAFEIYFIGNLGHYIPGKVWTVAGVAWLAERRGIPPMVAGAAAVFAQAYSIISSLAFFPVFLIFSNTQPSWMHPEWMIPAILLFVGFFIFPANMERALNLALTLLKRERVSLGLTLGKALRLTGLYFVSWVLFGIAFWVFVIAVTGNRDISPVLLTGAYAAAYVVGYLAFFVPSGLGVREGVAGYLLASVMPAGVALLVTFLVRLPVTLVELLCVLIILIRKGLPYGKNETNGGKRR